MSKIGLISRTIKSTANIKNGIDFKLEHFFRQKSIKRVNEKLILHLKAEDISSEDYEALVELDITKLKKDYAITSLKATFGLFGFSLFIGI